MKRGRPDQRPQAINGTMVLTRQQRRALERHAVGVDVITQADRRYFERFPHRRYRIRRASAAEIASAEAVDALGPALAGRVRFTLIKNLAPGCRLRIFVHGPADQSGDETGEALAAALWDDHLQSNPWIAEREAMMLAAAKAPGGPLNGGGRDE